MLSTRYEFKAGIAIPLSQPRSNVCQILSQAHTHTPSEVSGFRLWLSQSGIEHGGGLISTASECSLNDVLWVMEFEAPLFCVAASSNFHKNVFFPLFFIFFNISRTETSAGLHCQHPHTPSVCVCVVSC